MEDDVELQEPAETLHVVGAGVREERVDKVLSAAYPEITRTRFHKLFDEGLVWRDGGDPMDKNDRVSAGDAIRFAIPENKPLDLTPAAIPLEVLFEDKHMVVINKAAGMVTHPGIGTGPDTLVHALLHHCAGQLSGIGGVERPGIVHRLDKDTSGVIVAAKTDKAFQKLHHMFRERTLVKEYLALVQGGPDLLSGTVDEPIGRSPRFRLKMAVRPDGREALTDWERVEKYGAAGALLKVQIHTGRTHQIRVHLSHKGWPIHGDALYGARVRPTDPPTARVMLHAARLALDHPVSGKALELIAPWPADFRACRDAWKKGPAPGPAAALPLAGAHPPAED